MSASASRKGSSHQALSGLGDDDGMSQLLKTNKKNSTPKKAGSNKDKNSLFSILISSPKRGPDLTGKSYLKAGIVDPEPFLPERCLIADPVLAYQVRCCEVNLGGFCRGLFDVQRGDKLQFRDSRTFFKREAQKIMLDNEAKFKEKTVEWGNQLDKTLPPLVAVDPEDKVLTQINWKEAHTNKQSSLNSLFAVGVSVLRERHGLRQRMVRNLHNAARNRNKTVLQHFKREDNAFEVVVWLLENYPSLALGDRHKNPKILQQLTADIQQNHPTVESSAALTGLKRFMQIVHLEPRSGVRLDADQGNESSDDEVSVFRPSSRQTQGRRNSWSPKIMRTFQAETTLWEDTTEEDYHINEPDADFPLIIKQLELDLREEGLRWHGSCTSIVMHQMKSDRDSWSDWKYLDERIRQNFVGTQNLNETRKIYETLETDLKESKMILKEMIGIINRLLVETHTASERVTSRAKTILVRRAGLDQTTEAQKAEADTKAGFANYDLRVPKSKFGKVELKGPAVRMPPSLFPSALHTIVPQKIERSDLRRHKEKHKHSNNSNRPQSQQTATGDEESMTQVETIYSPHSSKIESIIGGAPKTPPSSIKKTKMKLNNPLPVRSLPLAVHAALLNKCVAVPDNAHEDELKSLLQDPVVMSALNYHAQFDGSGEQSWALSAARQRTRETIKHLKRVSEAVNDYGRVSSLRVCLPVGTKASNSRVRVVDELPESPRSRQKLFSKLGEALSTDIEKLQAIVDMRRVHPHKQINNPSPIPPLAFSPPLETRAEGGSLHKPASFKLNPIEKTRKKKPVLDLGTPPGSKDIDIGMVPVEVDSDGEDSEGENNVMLTALRPVAFDSPRDHTPPDVSTGRLLIGESPMQSREDMIFGEGGSDEDDDDENEQNNAGSLSVGPVYPPVVRTGKKMIGITLALDDNDIVSPAPNKYS